MKLLLWMICLCISVHISLASRALVKREVMTDATPANTARRHMAKTFKIANMNELSWSDNLKRKAQRLSCNAKHGPDYRVFLMPDDNDPVTRRLVQEVFQRMDADSLQKIMNSNDLDFFELFVPNQKSIGCAPLVCKIPVKSMQIVSSEICVMGPDTHVEKLKDGDAGSKCGRDGDNDGLCKNDGSDTNFQAPATRRHWETATRRPLRRPQKRPTTKYDRWPSYERPVTLESIPTESTPPPPTSSSSTISFFIIPLIVSIVLIV